MNLPSSVALTKSHPINQSPNQPVNQSTTMRFFQTLFISIGVGLLAGSYFVIDHTVAIGVGMRLLGFVAIVLSFVFRE